MVVKDGKNSSKNQVFKCKICLKRFVVKRKDKTQFLLASYIKEKKILSTLAKNNKTSISTIQRALKSIDIAKPTKPENIKEVILLVDATYWGTGFGVVVFKDAISKKFIWWHFVERTELLDDYKLGLKWCLNNGYIIKAIVADGLKGLAKIIKQAPFQICQVHIQRTIQTKLTKKPKSAAGVELLELSKRLTMLSKESFIKELDLWQEKHKEFLNEKSIDDSGRLRYTHRILRSAHYTLKRNIAYLFTYENVENLPKTNNGLESEFAHLKTKLRVHNGLKLENKMKFISNYFSLKNNERNGQK